MKVEKQNAGSCRVRVVVKLEADEVRKQYNEILAIFMAKANVPGFRQGKVPREVVLREFHDEINKQVQSLLFHDTHEKALKEVDVKVVNILDVEDMVFSPETGFMFTMVVDVEPVFDLPKYSKFNIPKKVPTVSDEQVKERLDELRRSYASFKEAASTEYAAQMGDMVHVDFVGLIDDKPISNFDETAKALSEGKGHWMQLEYHMFPVTQFIDTIIGMKCEESKEFKVEFSKEFCHELLRGKKAVYSVTLKGIRQLVLPDDHAMLEILKLGSIDEVFEKLRGFLQEVANQETDDLRMQTLHDMLLKNADFSLPESQVSEEIKRSLENMLAGAKERGVKLEELSQERDEIIKNVKRTSESRVRTSYILRGIAEKEGIVAEPADIDLFIKEMAYLQKRNLSELRATLEKNEHMEEVAQRVVEQKTFKYLLEMAEK